MTKIPSADGIKEITEAVNFYGYLVGLSVGRLPLSLSSYDKGDLRLFATFMYNGTKTTYEVPDLELFKILSEYLMSTAWDYKNSDGDTLNKLYIEKKDGRWLADLP